MIKTLACPVCGKAAVWQGNPDRPFCSDRCRTVDLGRWADESYRVAAEPSSSADLDESAED